MNNENEKIVGYDPNNGQPIYETQNNMCSKPKKKKYWLIPVFIFLAMISSKIVQFIILLVFESMSEVKPDFLSGLNVLFTLIFIFCGLAFWPSVILAVILSVTKK